MKMIKKTAYKKVLLVTILLISVVGVAVFLRFSKASSLPRFNKPADESFLAPGRDWPSEKKVEDYFVSNLRMTQEEAKDSRSTSKGNDGKVMLRLREETTLEALISNLEYYGFVRDKEALRYALEHSEDKLTGKTDALKVGGNTIDVWAFYRISEDMSTWEIADQLLNKPSHFSFDEYGYMFMP